jgi:hypothetical protein
VSYYVAEAIAAFLGGALGGFLCGEAIEVYKKYRQKQRLRRWLGR